MKNVLNEEKEKVIKKEEANEEEPSIIKYIINKEEMFKLIKHDNLDKNKTFSIIKLEKLLN